MATTPLPREFWLVRWRIVRNPFNEHEHERVEKARTFKRATDACSQVLTLWKWIEHVHTDGHPFAELLGVWHTSGWVDGRLVWDELDPADLPVPVWSEDDMEGADA